MADYTTVLDRLSRASVETHFDAYADVDWDAPDLAVDPADLRWRLWDLDPLTDTDWYRAQSPETQARLGLSRVATAMRLGWEFENVLQRGLLERAFWLPNGTPEFRYLHHEIVEESHHTMMFQELVNRSGLDVGGMPRYYKVMSRLVLRTSRKFPALFFLFVIGGEDPVDYLQRRQLKAGGVHPLAERIMRIHVTEEARHLSFARTYLRTRVPALSRVRRTVLAYVAPILFARMARLMVRPTRQYLTANGVPRAVAREAARSPRGRAVVRDSVGKSRALCEEIGIVTPVTRRIWRLLGVGA